MNYCGGHTGKEGMSSKEEKKQKKGDWEFCKILVLQKLSDMKKKEKVSKYSAKDVKETNKKKIQRERD